MAYSESVTRQPTVHLTVSRQLVDVDLVLGIPGFLTRKSEVRVPALQSLRRG
jgi:hypothetical protein